MIDDDDDYEYGVLYQRQCQHQLVVVVVLDGHDDVAAVAVGMKKVMSDHVGGMDSTEEVKCRDSHPKFAADDDERHLSCHAAFYLDLDLGRGPEVVMHPPGPSVEDSI